MHKFKSLPRVAAPVARRSATSCKRAESYEIRTGRSFVLDETGSGPSILAALPRVKTLHQSQH